jgi:hypothetical protein
VHPKAGQQSSGQGQRNSKNNSGLTEMDFENIHPDPCNSPSSAYMFKEEFTLLLKEKFIETETEQKGCSYNENLGLMGTAVGGKDEGRCQGNFNHLHPVYGSKKIFLHDQDPQNNLEGNSQLMLRKTGMTILPRESNSSSETAIVTKTLVYDSQRYSTVSVQSGAVGTTALQKEDAHNIPNSNSPLTGNKGIE